MSNRVKLVLVGGRGEDGVFSMSMDPKSAHGGISFRALTEYCVRSLRGYYTRYDCSSADINPIGSISKKDLKRFISWARTKFCLPILEEFLTATPTAELEPITKDYVQADEVDMGMTYDELSTFGTCRKVLKLGPYGMFQKLVHEWKGKLKPSEVATKVKVSATAVYTAVHEAYVGWKGQVLMTSLAIFPLLCNQSA